MVVMKLGQRTAQFVAGGKTDDVTSLGRGEKLAFPAVDPIARLRRVALRRAAHPALVFQGEALNYAQLTERVGQLASRLRELGVQPDERVAICVPRGPDEPISMLSVWAAGGAYVPLDPSHPAERIRIILEDARPQVLITHEAVASTLDIPEGVRVLWLDREQEMLRHYRPLPLHGPRSPEQLAYILFTSGSTGRPKGVGVPRRAIANFLRSMAHTPGMSETDRLLSVTTITFDIAGLELFLPLWVGATVHIANRETALDAHKLRRALSEQDITMMQATPTTWRLLLEAGFGENGTELRMLCGGEAMSRELANRLTATGGELWNLYGPTETTVWSTVWRVPSGAHTISIGRPIDETQIYIMDESMKLVPRGEIGELCIGGVGVARGYFERDDLTRARFVQNPYGSRGDIIYRTGDLARWMQNGEIECLGRIDHQVKIRGFRIELGEIESAMRSVPGVRDAVVIARAEEGKDPQLIAYYEGQAPQADIRARVRAALPSYMHPAAYVALETMPLNTNGKVDRKQLPAPELTSKEGPDAPVMGPRNDAEVTMAALFEEVLGVERPSVDVDLFTLGGSSVQAMELRRRIYEQFRVELPLPALFESPSIERLVRALHQGGEVQERPAFVPLARGHEDLPPLLCLMGITLYRDLAKSLADGRTVYGVHVPFDPSTFEEPPRLEDLARLYVDVILEHVPRGPYHVAGLCFGGLLSYEVAHQLVQRGREVGSVTLLDAALPRAEHYSLSQHAKHVLKRTLVSPKQALTNLRGGVLRALGIAPAGQNGQVPASQIGFDVDGPLAQAMVRDYDTRVPTLDVPLLLCRALDRGEATWRHTDYHMGFLGLSSKISVAPITGSHIEILKAPNVLATASAVRRLLSSPPERESVVTARPPVRVPRAELGHMSRPRS
jgi:amino acid adenylation domain-containing protein